MNTLPAALLQADEHLGSGDGYSALRVIREAQRLQPSSAELGVRLIEACLASEQLMCAAHGSRTVLRSAEADDASSCRHLVAARAFGSLAARLRWCPVAEPCSRVTNRSAVSLEDATASSIVTVDDGQLWSGENMVRGVKAMLADDKQWKGGGDGTLLNHATMQHIQGNRDVALQLYEKSLSAPSHTIPSAHAHAHANMAMLTMRSSRARTHLESALRLAPASAEASEWWLSLAQVNWLHGQPSHARRALRHSLQARPDSALAHALDAELESMRTPLPPPYAHAHSLESLASLATLCP